MEEIKQEEETNKKDETIEEQLPKSLEELRKHLKSEKIIYGTDRSLKLLKQGKLSRIYLSSNTPKQIKNDIEHYARLSKIEIFNLEIPNDELGTFCKKPFPVSVIGLMK